MISLAGVVCICSPHNAAQKATEHPNVVILSVVEGPLLLG